MTSPLTGRNLVEASAGTGKTFAIAGLFVRLLLEERLTVDQILVVTFTEAATEELRGRIRARLRGALEAYRLGACGAGDDFLARLLLKVPPSEDARLRLTEALRCFDEAPVYTIHGFCQRVLQEKAFECGEPFDAELVTDEGPFLQEVVDDFWRRELYGASPALAAHARRSKVTPESLAELAGRKARARDLRVLPEPAPDAGAAAEAACRAAFEVVRKLWPGAREQVRELLSTHPGLNRNSYRAASVPAWVAALDPYLAGGDPLDVFERFEKFCSGEIRAKTRAGHAPPEHPFFEACQALAEAREAFAGALDRALLSLQTRLVAHVREELPRRKAEQGVRSFDDLLRGVHDALAGEKGPALARALRERYRAALIDEFQDTDPTQYAIFRAVYPDESCRLFLIGDPKQAIYSFRGADVFAYLDAAAHADERWTLGRNWRSTPELIRAVNAVFSNAPDPFVLRDIPFHPVSPAPVEERKALVLEGVEDRAPLRLWFAGRAGDKVIGKGAAGRLLPAAVAGEVLGLLEAGAGGRATLGGKALEAGDLAVLVRTNRQAAQVKRALDELGIPGVLYSSASLFASAEAEELLRVLAAVAEPRSERRLRAALVTALLGATGDDLARLDADEEGWNRRLQRFARYRDLWDGRGFAVMARTLLAEEGVRERLLPLLDGERRLTNVLHCVEVLQRAAVEGKLGPEGLVQWLGRRVEAPTEDEEYQLRLETDERAVKVVTVHKSKGLEYAITFVPFAWGGSRQEKPPLVFHDPETPLRVVLDLGSERLGEHRRLAEEEALAENLRLLYVALTRARNRCHLVWGAFRDAETSSLAHLLHPAPEGGSSDDGQDRVERLAARVSALSDGALLGELETLAEGAGGTIDVASLPPPAPPGTRYAPPREEARELRCRELGRRIPTEWGVSSFSSLVSGRDDAAELPDRDEWIGRSPAAEPEIPQAPTLFDFPRGPKAGNCLHAVLEDLDYAADRAGVESVVAEKLDFHGLDRAWASPVSDGLQRLLQTPLDPADAGLVLSRVPRADRVHELEFYLPTGLFSPSGLAAVFSAHRGPTVPAELPEALGALGFRPTRGFLKGFVDLVFQSGGRYHIVDWKSNHLGNRVQDYGPEALQAAVDEHLYALQYHLYAAALHRHLSVRLPGYDYDRHFGGIYYVFLRGVDPAAPGWSVHRARPPRALVEAVSAFLAAGDPQ